MKYYKVTAKCGHVGKGQYCIKNFYVKADSKKEARNMVRKRPRVKKSVGNPIVDIHRISYNSYRDGLREWHDDPYFQCRTPEDILKFKENGHKFEKAKLPGRFDGKNFVRKPKRYKQFNHKLFDER